MGDDGGHSGGRSKPPALNIEGSGASNPPQGRYAVVPADQLLDVAAALSVGATRLHEQLRHLRPEDRDAVLDAVANQLSEIVSLFTSLVRGVVTAGAAQEPPTSGRAQPEAGFVVADTGTEPKLAVVTSEHAVTSAPVPVLVEPEVPPSSAASDNEASEPEPAVHVNPYRRPAPAGAEVPAPLEPHTRDELTGVLTRQAGFAALTKEIDRCRHGGDRFVLGYLDVDGLQAVNEARVPRAGDELLRKVTAALRATLRSYDVICRLGGDEFLFSLPGADMATAELRFKEFAVILAEEAPGGSASVGFARIPRERHHRRPHRPG